MKSVCAKAPGCCDCSGRAGSRFVVVVRNGAKLRHLAADRGISFFFFFYFFFLIVPSANKIGLNKPNSGWLVFD